ncbi:hypothetical protein E2C01_097326 [Portunus trituberculatus]|uniref:Uncharacterized protein n=1 Tax=Portunus trituberculatus TaxID=210409 RepID=A0A5B7JY09_PORTR|nr:hypothetical protein [Portunus trituberculatus]
MNPTGHDSRQTVTRQL